MEFKKFIKPLIVYFSKNIDGNGIWHDGQHKFAFGKWEEDTLKEGMLIHKN